MLLNGSFFGVLFGGFGSILTQQYNQTHTHTNKNTATEAVAETPDSGGVRFDLSPAAISGAGAATATANGSGTSNGSAGEQAQDEGANGDANAGAAASNGAAGPSQADDDAALNAYFYAAKWAQSIQPQVAEEVAAPDTGKKVSFATEPYRHDVLAQYFTEQSVHFGGKKLATIGANGVVTMADAAQTTGSPYQAPKSLGSF